MAQGSPHPETIVCRRPMGERTVAILQSNYLPWRGYFDLIQQADVLVVYDDVQYTKHDWRNRNLIKTAQGTRWITVPVVFSLDAATAIDETPINYTKPWVDEHISVIGEWYRTTPHYAQYSKALFSILAQRFASISALNITLMRWVMAELGIERPMLFARDHQTEMRRTERVVELTRWAGGKRYLSGPAGRAYIERERFAEAKIDLTYKTYDFPEYPQRYRPFVPAVSIIDLLFNVGPRAGEFVAARSDNEDAVVNGTSLRTHPAPQADPGSIDADDTSMG